MNGHVIYIHTLESFANLNLTNPNTLSHLIMPVNLIAMPQPQEPQPSPMSFEYNEYTMKINIKSGFGEYTYYFPTRKRSS